MSYLLIFIPNFSQPILAHDKNFDFMHFEKLEKNPISGDYAEKHFGESTLKPVWVKFNLNEIDSWVGSFESGKFNLEIEKLYKVENKNLIAILINGAFYLVDYLTKELVFKPEDSFYIDFQINSEKNQIYLAAFWGIYIFEDYKLIKKIRPGFIDGIRFNEFKN